MYYITFLAASRFTGKVPMEEILMIGDDVRDDVLGLLVLRVYHGISTLPLRSPGGGSAGRAGQNRQVQAW